MSTLAKYRARVSAHSVVNDTIVATFLSDSTTRLDIVVWGDLYDEAVIYRAAHFVEIDRRANNDSRKGAGPVTGENLGADGVGTTYGRVMMMNDQDSFWESTPWGILFVTLKRTLVLTPVIMSI